MGVELVELAGHAYPLAHRPDAALSPMVAQKDPAGHAIAAPDPATAYEPASVANCVAWVEPASQ